MKAEQIIRNRPHQSDFSTPKDMNFLWTKALPPHNVGHIFQKIYNIPESVRVWVIKKIRVGWGRGYLSGPGPETLTEWKFETVTYLQTDLQGRC